MTLNELYIHVFDLITLVFAREGITASIYISDTSSALPVTEDPYIVIGYTPTTLQKIGNVTFGDITDDPEEENSYLVRQTPYEGRVEIRQINGDGDLLRLLISSFEAVYVTEFLTPTGLSLVTVDTAITPIPFRIDNKVHKESVVSPVFSFYDSIREDLDWVENVSIAGSIENPDNGEIRDVEITDD